MTNRLFPGYIRKLPGKIFLLGYVIIFPLLFVATLLYSREETHIAINSIHTSYLDVLMKYWTYLGNGIVLIILIIGLLFISLRLFFSGIAAFAIGGVITQLLKVLIFSKFPRPIKYFELYHPEFHLHLVPGVHMLTWLSFPSGHTATAFSLFFALALFTKNKFTQLALFIMATGVGYSRIYLSQHFLMDVVGGSLIGIITGWIAWIWLKRYDNNWIDNSISQFLIR